MTSDLSTLLSRTLADLRLLADAAPDIDADRQPPGIDYSRQHVSGSAEADDRVGPLQLVDGWPRTPELEGRWRQAMRTLARAFADISEAEAVQRLLFAGEGDNIAQASVHPDVTDHADNAARLHLAWLITHRLVDAHHHEGLSFADQVHTRGWCEEVHDAANTLPEWIRTAGMCGHCRKPAGGLRLCLACRKKQGECLNPRRRDQCRLLIANHKRQLCRSCDQARRDAERDRASLTAESHAGNFVEDVLTSGARKSESVRTTRCVTCGRGGVEVEVDHAGPVRCECCEDAA